MEGVFFVLPQSDNRRQKHSSFLEGKKGDTNGHHDFRNVDMTLEKLVDIIEKERVYL